MNDIPGGSQLHQTRSSEGVIILDLEGRVVFLNSIAQSLTGWTLTHAVHQLLDEIFVLVDGPAHSTPGDTGAILISRDGTRHRISSDVTPIQNRDGQPLGTVLVFRNIVSEREQMEEAIRVAEEQFHLVTNNMAAAVTRCSRELKYVWVSPVYAQWLDRKPEDIAGRDILEVVGREGYDALRPHFEKVLSGEKEEYEQQVHFQGIGNRWIHAVYVPTRDSSGNVNGWVAVVTDITDRKILEQERERLLELEHEARTSAEDANRLKDEFLASVSHELRTPLNAIFGWARLLRTRQLGKTEVDQAIETIERNARIQTRLIEDLLDVSRITSGQLRLDMRPIVVTAVVQCAIDAVKPTADAKGVQLEARVDPMAGPVCADASRLQQVLWNLLSNAIKFTPREGNVLLQVRRVNSEVEIIIKDTGQGIRKEFLPSVFERFRQADGGTTRRHSGLGIGLAIVRQLVEMHGGTVNAESPGQGLGATFTVRLPTLPGAWPNAEVN